MRIVFLLGCILACMIGCVACPNAPCHAAIVLKISDVTILRSTLPTTVLIPITAYSDEPGLKLSGFNLNFDIGGDGQASLPLGVTLPAALPDDKSIIASGGEVNAQSWFLITVTAVGIGLTSSDILITGNSPAFQTDIAIQGDPALLTGGTLLFQLALNLDPSVANRVDVTMPSELNAVLPFMTDSLGNELAVNYLPGSVTLTSVPEPGAAALALMGMTVVTGMRPFRRRVARR